MESPDKTAKELAKAARTAGRVVGRLEATEKLLRGHVQRMGERLEPGRRFVEPGFARTADEIVEEGRTLLGHDRLGVLWQAVRNSRHLDLPMLEIGAFRGGSARFLGRAWKQLSGSDARLHIIDTFVGHAAEQITGFDPHHQAGRFGGTSRAEVAAYLSDLPGAQIHQGAVPQALDLLPRTDFALVHLDVDLYIPTLRSLESLTDRLPPGAVVVVDDFGSKKCSGVQKAVHEFLDRDVPFAVWSVDTEQLVLVRR